MPGRVTVHDQYDGTKPAVTLRLDVNVYKGAAAPTTDDGLEPGDWWTDTSGATPLLKVCKQVTPSVTWGVVTPV